MSCYLIVYTIRVDCIYFNVYFNVQQNVNIYTPMPSKTYLCNFTKFLKLF